MARARRPSEGRASWRNDGIRVDIQDGKLNVVAKKHMRGELARILNRIVRQAKILTANKAAHPYSRTGALSRSIRKTPIKSLNQHAVTGSVTAGGRKAPYARHVHEGTQPHIITARPGNPTGLLRFYWVNRGTYSRAFQNSRIVNGPNGPYVQKYTDKTTKNYADRLVLTPSVQHPGARPKPFLIRAAREVTGYTAVRRR